MNPAPASRPTQSHDGVSDRNAATPDDLVPLVYDDLRAIADQLLRHRRHNGAPQTTSLVNEAYLRLVNNGKSPFQNRAHFLCVAAKAMRCVLVDRARRRHAAKRGGGVPDVPLYDEIALPEGSPDLIALDDALTRMTDFDERRAKLVELRFFGGLTIEETAETLGVSVATIKRDWALAKAWLFREIKGRGE